MHRALLLLLLPFAPLLSESLPDSTGAYTPWYTGTLQASASQNAAPGQLVIQPYFDTLYRYGSYDDRWKYHPLEIKEWGFVNTLYVQWGLTDRLDFSITPEMITSFQNGTSETLFSDLNTQLGIQILQQLPGTWVPDVRFILQVEWPTGKFDNGELPRLATDFSGLGAFQVGGIIAIGKTFYTYPEHPFRLNFNLGYTGLSDVTIKGISVYGGDPFTFGVMHPGTAFFMYLTGEVSITQRLALAVETFFEYKGQNRFEGINIFNPFENVERFSLNIVPQVEYSWTANMGVVGGVTYQFTGYNSVALVGLLLSFVYTY